MSVLFLVLFWDFILEQKRRFPSEMLVLGFFNFVRIFTIAIKYHFSLQSRYAVLHKDKIYLYRTYHLGQALTIYDYYIGKWTE